MQELDAPDLDGLQTATGLHMTCRDQAVGLKLTKKTQKQVPDGGEVVGEAEEADEEVQVENTWPEQNNGQMLRSRHGYEGGRLMIHQGQSVLSLLPP